MRRYTEAIARGVGVQGLLNVQYALKDDALYVLEANPRASRTVPFVSKATAVPLAKAAARIMLGATVAELRAEGVLRSTGDGGSTPPDAPIAIKEAVLPFKRFRTPGGQGVDSLLGPEMKSTGEVMGIDTGFGQAYAKSQAAAYGSLPTNGKIFVSVANRDKRAMIFPIKRLADLGFTIVTTAGTGEVLRRHGIECEVVPKHFESPGSNAIALIAAGEIALIINTPQGSGASARSDGYELRSAAVTRGHPEHHHHPGRRGGGDGHRGADARRHGGPAAAGAARGAAGAIAVTLSCRYPPSGRSCSGWAAATPSGRTSSRCARLAGRRRPPVRRCGERARAAGRRVDVFGVRLPRPGRARGRDGQGRRGAARLAGARLRLRRGRHGHRAARSRATTGRGCSGCRPARRVINRMGFNNAGAAALAARLEALGPLPGAAGHLARQVQGRRRSRRRSTTT